MVQIIADVSMWRSPSVLVNLRRPLFIPMVIDYATDSHEDESLKDADDHDTHDNPLGDFREEVAFDDLAPSESDECDDDCGDYRRPQCDFGDKLLLVHTQDSYNKVVKLL